MSKYSEFVVEEKLSETTRGTVSVVKHKRTHRVSVCRRSFIDDANASASFADFWFWQQKAIKPVPGLVTIERQPWKEKPYIYELYEKVYGDDLHFILDEAINQNKLGTLDWKNFTRSCIRQIATTLIALHEQRWAFIDLSLDNVMVEKATQRCKLIDFESTFQLKENPYIHAFALNNRVCKKTYIAPEALRWENCCFDPRWCDIWALGVMTVLLISGEYPYDKPDQTDNFFDILVNGGFRNWINYKYNNLKNSPFDNESMDLLEKIFTKCIIYDHNDGWRYLMANNRLSAKQIAEHRFCQNPLINSHEIERANTWNVQVDENNFANNFDSFDINESKTKNFDYNVDNENNFSITKSMESKPTYSNNMYKGVEPELRNFD